MYSPKSQVWVKPVFRSFRTKKMDEAKSGSDDDPRRTIRSRFWAFEITAQPVVATKASAKAIEDKDEKKEDEKEEKEEEDEELDELHELVFGGDCILASTVSSTTPMIVYGKTTMETHCNNETESIAYIAVAPGNPWYGMRENDMNNYSVGYTSFGVPYYIKGVEPSTVDANGNRLYWIGFTRGHRKSYEQVMNHRDFDAALDYEIEPMARWLWNTVNMELNSRITSDSKLQERRLACCTEMQAAWLATKEVEKSTVDSYHPGYDEYIRKLHASWSRQHSCSMKYLILNGLSKNQDDENIANDSDKTIQKSKRTQRHLLARKKKMEKRRMKTVSKSSS